MSLTLCLFHISMIFYSQGRPSSAALSSFEEVARSLAHVRAATTSSAVAVGRSDFAWPWRRQRPRAGGVRIKGNIFLQPKKITNVKKKSKKNGWRSEGGPFPMSSHGCCRNEWPFRGPQVPFKSPKRISLRRGARNLEYKARTKCVAGR